MTTSKLAKKHKIKTAECLKQLVSQGYLDLEHNLTNQGISAGAESKKGRYGQYYLWPQKLLLQV